MGSKFYEKDYNDTTKPILIQQDLGAEIRIRFSLLYHSNSLEVLGSKYSRVFEHFFQHFPSAVNLNT
jgi:hypothetical protein